MTPEDRKTWVALMGARSDWWALGAEPALAPGTDIVDAHVHLWDARDFPDPATGEALRTSRYLIEELQRDTTGHRVAQVVYVECGSGWRTDGPANLRPVGETEFASAMAARLAALGGPVIAAIVAHADMRDPGLDAVIDAHRAVEPGLVRGLRHSAARLADPAARLLAGAAPPGLSADPAYRRGVARLGERGLTFDAFAFHFQLAEIAGLARAAPGTTIVVNHLGGPVGYATPDPVFAPWARSVDALAACPNVVMKLGGLTSLVTGYDGASRPRPPSSAEFLAERGAYFHHAINAFGPDRCLFESNFPVDSTSIGYDTLWNAYKIIAADHGLGAPALLAGTARRVYGFASPV